MNFKPDHIPIFLGLLLLPLSLFGFDVVVPGKRIEFPRDAGAHMGHRVEWWYVTGNLETKRGPMGFQVTFFRALSQNQIESRGDRLSSPTALADP